MVVLTWGADDWNVWPDEPGAFHCFTTAAGPTVAATVVFPVLTAEDIAHYARRRLCRARAARIRRALGVRA